MTYLFVRLWPWGVPTPSTDIGLPPLLAAISPLSSDLRAGWTNNVGTVDLLLGHVAERIALFYSFTLFLPPNKGPVKRLINKNLLICLVNL